MTLAVEIITTAVVAYFVVVGLIVIAIVREYWHKKD